METNFYKYQGTGNDFILIDNRQLNLLPSKEVVQQLCHRQFGIGADGLILLNNVIGYDFEMIYYNADGNISTMCGNGGRCIIQFAFDRGIQKEQYHFLAADGAHKASIENDIIKLQMQDVDNLQKSGADFVLNTGSPHYVSIRPQVSMLNVQVLGSQIRQQSNFGIAGINVNFVEQQSADTLFVRTYERGVEAETLSCGTGVTAAALVAADDLPGNKTTYVNTLGGKLKVTFFKKSENQFRDIYLCGPATFVFTGIITI